MLSIEYKGSAEVPLYSAVACLDKPLWMGGGGLVNSRQANSTVAFASILAPRL